MREALRATPELARKLAALEKKLTARLDVHEAAIVQVLRGLEIHWASGTNILLAVNCQGCGLGVRNCQPGHVGESGAFSGLIGAGTGIAVSSTPMRLFTQCTW